MAADTALTSVLSSSSFYTLCGSNVRKTKGSASSFGGAVTCTGFTLSASGTGNTTTMTNFSPVSTGNFQVSYFGVSQTGSYNCAWHLFKNTGGSGSTSNYAAFGVQGYGVGTGSFNACGNGNFGVCTASPSYTLDVNGTLWASSNFAVSGGTVTLPSGSVAASAIASLDASKITTGTFSVGAFGTNLSTTGALTLPGFYYKSYTIACDTTADCAYEFASFTTGTATTLDVTIVSPKTTGTEFTKRYSITVGSSLLTADGAWRRCIPLSAHNGHPLDNDYELHVSSPGTNSVPGGSTYDLRLRLLHSMAGAIASTLTVNVTAYYAQDGLFATSTLSSIYVDDTWRTLSYLPSTAMKQYGGQVGLGTTSPSYKLDVAGSLHASGAVTFDSTLTAGAVSTSGAITTTGTGTKYWNATTQGQYSATPGTLYKIGVLPAIGEASGGGAVRICGSMGGFGTNQSVTVDCTISSRGVNPGSSATYDLGTSALAWRHEYLSGNRFCSGNAGFTANSTAALTPAAPFHFFGAQDANTNTMIIGSTSTATGLILEDIVNAKWRINTGGYALTFSQQTSGTTSSYGTANFTTRVTFSSNTYVTAARNVYAGSTVYANNVALTSDARLKSNVQPIQRALERVCRLAGKTFDFTPPNVTQTRSNVSGFIAQEVKDVFPEWVVAWDNDSNVQPGQEPMLGIDVGYGLQAHLVEAVKELRSENAELRATVARVTEQSEEEELRSLRQEVAELRDLAASLVNRVTIREQREGLQS
ncbi:hypothetical protein KFL_010840030 [Klebsormidium nitens]|uniref:Peptidase S74 domain-containing protein n=1 Tax=Klebsormidium nitens TaxID=105231 RepID=A0A1Y1ITI8_KLENI|nr:hypothetical protein KFL_010840030 [Klebsormidium nitens]|eukprot:GAQ92651.1 hypothetical protein KFL_010840030 [Klebsormidium nitens]